MSRCVLSAPLARQTRLSSHRCPPPLPQEGSHRRGVDSQNEGEKNIENSTFETGSPRETTSDLADFHQRQGHAPRFARKGRQIALGRCRMGRYEGRSPERLRASSQDVEAWLRPPAGGSDDPPLRKLGPPPSVMRNGSPRKKVGASTCSSSGPAMKSCLTSNEVSRRQSR